MSNLSPEMGPVPEEEIAKIEKPAASRKRGGFFTGLSKRARNAVVGTGLAASALAGAAAKPAEAGGGDIPLVGATSASQEFSPGITAGFEAVEAVNRGLQTRFLAGNNELAVRNAMLEQIVRDDEMNPEEAGRQGNSAMLIYGQEPKDSDLGALTTSREPGFPNVRVPNALFYATRLGLKGYQEWRGSMTEQDRTNFPDLQTEQQVQKYLEGQGFEPTQLKELTILLGCVEVDIVSSAEPRDLRLVQTYAENGEGDAANPRFWKDLKASYQLEADRAPLTETPLAAIRAGSPDETGAKRVVRLINTPEVASMIESEKITRVYVTVHLEGIKSQEELDRIADQINRLSSSKDLFVNVIAADREKADTFIASLNQVKPQMAWQGPGGKTLNISQ